MSRAQAIIAEALSALSRDPHLRHRLAVPVKIACRYCDRDITMYPRHADRHERACGGARWTPRAKPLWPNAPLVCDGCGKFYETERWRDRHRAKCVRARAGGVQP